MLKRIIKSWDALWKYFFYIGFSYGPMVYTLARNSFIKKLKLITEKDIMDGIALAQVMPGAVFIDFVSYIGFLLRKTKGAFVAMLIFIFPSFLLMIILTYLYLRYGEIGVVQHVLKGLSAIMIALIIKVILDIYNEGVKNPAYLIISGIGLLLLILNLNIVLILIMGIILAILYGIYKADISIKGKRISLPHRADLNNLLKDNLWVILFMLFLIIVNMTFYFVYPDIAIMNTILFKIGLLTFGNGYTMLPFISKEVVNNYHWLTIKQFSDGIVLSQITPGPVAVMATFIGYKVAGIVGAITATLSIFLPSTMLVAVVAKPFLKYKDHKMVTYALKGILSTFIGLLILVVAQISKTSITDYKTALFALVALILFIYTKINPIIVLIIGVAISIIVL